MSAVELPVEQPQAHEYRAAAIPCVFLTINETTWEPIDKQCNKPASWSLVYETSQSFTACTEHKEGVVATGGSYSFNGRVFYRLIRVNPL